MTPRLRDLSRELNLHVSEASANQEDAFGIGRLSAVLRSRLKTSQGIRPGRPTDETWSHRPKVPMSQETIDRLAVLASEISTAERKVTPMQVVAYLVEEALSHYFRPLIAIKEKDDLPIASMGSLLASATDRFEVKTFGLSSSPLGQSQPVDLNDSFSGGRFLHSFQEGDSEMKELCIVFRGQEAIEQPFVCELEKRLKTSLHIRGADVADIIERGRFDAIGYTYLCVPSVHYDFVTSVAKSLDREVFSDFEQMQRAVYGTTTFMLRAPIDNVRNGIPIVRLTFDIAKMPAGSIAQPYELFHESKLQFAILSAASTDAKTVFYIRLCDGSRIITDPNEFTAIHDQVIGTASFPAGSGLWSDAVQMQVISKVDADIPKRLPIRIFGAERPFERMHLWRNDKGNLECLGVSPSQQSI